MKNISSHEYVDLFCSVFNKIIPDATTPYLLKVGGGNSTPHVSSKAKYFLICSAQFSKAI